MEHLLEYPVRFEVRHLMPVQDELYPEYNAGYDTVYCKLVTVNTIDEFLELMNCDDELIDIEQI